MARSKATARKPKTPSGNQNEIKVGRVEKPKQVSTEEKSELKVAAKETPKALQKKQNKPPMSKKKKREIMAARESLASGETASEDQVRRKERDTRTLYIRFKDKQKLPENLECVKALHEDIQIARVPRQCAKKIQYAYLEFGTEAKLEVAKLSMEKNANLYVDYVGIGSKGGGKPKEERGGKGRNGKQINPTRLFITGLIDGMTEDKLKLLFPKCCSANIPKGSIRKGTLYGFVQFTNPADAKSAFEAAKKLTVQTQEGKEGQRITVLYATATKNPRAKQKEDPAEKPVNEKKKKSNTTIDSNGEVKGEIKNDPAENDKELVTKNAEVENGKKSKGQGKVVKKGNAATVEKEETDDNTDSDDDQDMENDADSEEEDADSNDVDENMENDEDSEEEDENSKDSSTNIEDQDEAEIEDSDDESDE